jgi:hypothetical protein
VSVSDRAHVILLGEIGGERLGMASVLLEQGVGLLG